MEKSITLKKIKRHRKHGFMHRMEAHSGRLVLKRRRDRKRTVLSV